MPSSWPGAAPPFDVAAGYHPFVDYRYVHAGRARWLDAAGHEPDFWDPAAGNSWLSPGHLAVPKEIRLELQPAAKSEPFIVGDKPWEYWLVDSVDTVTGVVHSVATTAANVADITQGPQLLHGGETRWWGRRRLPGRGSAPRAPRPGRGLAGGLAARATAAVGAGRRSERRSSIPFSM